MNNRLPNVLRQAESRAKKKSAGFVRLTLRFDSKTATRLRRMAKSNETTQAQVIQAALILFDNKQLLKDVQAWAAESKPTSNHGWHAPCSRLATGDLK